MGNTSRSKRTHGTGSVRWRDGAWRIQVYAGQKPDGRPRFISRTVRTANTMRGRREAEREALALAQQIEVEQRASIQAGSFAELVERWIRHRATSWVEGAEQDTRRRLEMHVLPTLGDRPIRDITAYDLDDLYAHLRDSGQSVASVKRIHTMVRASLRQAVKWRLIPYNPADAADPGETPQRADTLLVTQEQARAIMAMAEYGWTYRSGKGAIRHTGGQPWLALMIRIAAHTGARRGELCRIKWGDVDLRRQTLTIWQTKTQRVKVLALGRRTAYALALHRWRETKALATEGAVIEASTWVFRSPARPGAHVAPNSVSQAWRRITRKLELPDELEMYSLRHGMATHLIVGEGIDPATVQRRGGWASPDVMMGVYTQRVTDADLRAADAMDAWIDA